MVALGTTPCLCAARVRFLQPTRLRHSLKRAALAMLRWYFGASCGFRWLGVVQPPQDQASVDCPPRAVMRSAAGVMAETELRAAANQSFEWSELRLVAAAAAAAAAAAVVAPAAKHCVAAVAALAGVAAAAELAMPAVGQLASVTQALCAMAPCVLQPGWVLLRLRLACGAHSAAPAAKAAQAGHAPQIAPARCLAYVHQALTQPADVPVGWAQSDRPVVVDGSGLAVGCGAALAPTAAMRNDAHVAAVAAVRVAALVQLLVGSAALHRCRAAQRAALAHGAHGIDVPSAAMTRRACFDAFLAVLAALELLAQTCLPWPPAQQSLVVGELLTSLPGRWAAENMIMLAHCVGPQQLKYAACNASAQRLSHSTKATTPACTTACATAHTPLCVASAAQSALPACFPE
jgi:hypothetical protein